MDPRKIVILRLLCYKRMTLREVQGEVKLSLSTIRDVVKFLIDEKYMTAQTSNKGYYLARSYESTLKGDNLAQLG